MTDLVTNLPLLYIFSYYLTIYNYKRRFFVWSYISF